MRAVAVWWPHDLEVGFRPLRFRDLKVLRRREPRRSGALKALRQLVEVHATLVQTEEELAAARAVEAPLVSALQVAHSKAIHEIWLIYDLTWNHLGRTRSSRHTRWAPRRPAQMIFPFA